MDDLSPDQESSPARKAVARRSSFSRRSFLAQAGATAIVPAALAAQITKPGAAGNHAASTYLDILRVPDRVTAYPRLKDPLLLGRNGQEWRGRGVTMHTAAGNDELAIRIASPVLELRYVHVRWQIKVSTKLLVLGDAWERSYGELGWRNLIAERPMPWYFATADAEANCDLVPEATFHCYGVKTGAAALCFWQLDAEGVSLWLNTSNGGSGVRLGARTLAAATVVARRGEQAEDQTAALRAFCRRMCSRPSRPNVSIYGSNDWYYAYGKNSAEQTLKDADFIAGLTQSNSVRPFVVVDDGWSAGAPAFPDMAKLAKEISARKTRPGLWIRPLQAKVGTDPRLLLPGSRFGERQERAKESAYDPTVPEARAIVLAKAKEVADWGYELIKHDFSTYELLGQWGSEMGPDPTLEGWWLHDRTRTNAEVITELYAGIREAVGSDKLVLGCNTVGHLGQGFFDASRTGDDTSGRVWERTRRMGVNTLAFRLPQHDAFFTVDADCVGITWDIAWAQNRQWMEVLAKSGTALFISPGPGARSADHAHAIRDAFEIASAGGQDARPLDCMQQSTPYVWGVPGHSADAKEYDWCSPSGAFPFSI